MNDKFKTIYYDTNDINNAMFMIGHNECTSFYRDSYVRKAITDIAQARPGEFTTGAAADIFRIGYIMGKRAVRARRKNAAASKPDDLNENKGTRAAQYRCISHMLDALPDKQLKRVTDFVQCVWVNSPDAGNVRRECQSVIKSRS